MNAQSHPVGHDVDSAARLQVQPVAVAAAQAQMFFKVSADQALILRRILVNASGIAMHDLQIMPIPHQKTVRMMLHMDAHLIDTIISTILTSMMSAEIGQIIRL